MARIRRITEAIATFLENIISLFFFAILAMTLILVALRYGLNTSIKGGYELTNYLFIYTTAIGAAVAVSRHEHIKIDFFVNMLHGKARRAADVLVQIMIAGINALVLYLSVNWIWQVGSFRSPVLRLPNWVVQVAIPVGAGLTILFCILNIVRDIIGDTDLGGSSDDSVAL